MDDNLGNQESHVLGFVKEFFNTYDKNRHVLHTLFLDDGSFILHGNRMSGHSAIQQAMLTMVSTTHLLISIDMTSLNMKFPENVSMYQVLCAGDVEFGNDAQRYGFTATFLVYFRQPNIINVVSFDERCQWPVLF